MINRLFKGLRSSSQCVNVVLAHESSLGPQLSGLMAGDLARDLSVSFILGTREFWKVTADYIDTEVSKRNVKNVYGTREIESRQTRQITMGDCD